MFTDKFNYTLSWSDFNQLSARPPGEKEDAQIHPESQPDNFVPAKKGNSIIIASVDIEIALVPEDCWVVSSVMSDELLKHEQGHYDIIAISAREFYNALLSKNFYATTIDKLQKKIDALKEKSEKDAMETDTRYDTLTNHGLNVQVQQTWNRKIEAAKKNPKGVINDLL